MSRLSYLEELQRELDPCVHLSMRRYTYFVRICEPSGARLRHRGIPCLAFHLSELEDRCRVDLW